MRQACFHVAIKLDTWSARTKERVSEIGRRHVVEQSDDRRLHVPEKHSLLKHASPMQEIKGIHPWNTRSDSRGIEALLSTSEATQNDKSTEGTLEHCCLTCSMQMSDNKECIHFSGLKQVMPRFS